MLGRHGVDAVLAEFGSGHIQPQVNIIAGLVAGFFNRLNNDFQCLFIGLQIGCKSPFIPQPGVQAFFFEYFMQMVEYFGTGAQRLGKGGQARGNNHEFLNIQVVVRMRSAI